VGSDRFVTLQIGDLLVLHKAVEDLAADETAVAEVVL
jgi:hypothetical protein